MWKMENDGVRVEWNQTILLLQVLKLQWYVKLPLSECCMPKTLLVCVCHCWAIARALRLISAGAYKSFYSIKRLGVQLPLDGMLVHRRIPPLLLLVPIYSWVERSNRSKATCPGLQTNVPVTGIEPMTLRL